jgi:hypothetical protein
MDKCPVCFDGRTITKVSAAGDEVYCTDCRKIVASATLDFEFKLAGAGDIQACKGEANGVALPGWKGPGKKARCFVYDPGKEGSEEAAKKKAANSAYSTQRKRSASIIMNATPGFSSFGTPDAVIPKATTPGQVPANSVTQNQSAALTQSAAPSTGGMAPKSQQAATPPQTPLGQVTAPNGMQPGVLDNVSPTSSNY